jgi:hypothetical protein
MKIRNQFLKTIPLALVFACFGAVTSGQELAGQDLPTLSPALHAALYPEVMCVHCIVPHWDHSYLVHVEFDRDPAVVTMYDRIGKKVLEGRMVPPEAVKASVGAAGATRAGGIVATGGGIMSDGSSQRFIVKSDPTGRVVQSVKIADFYTRQVCEATDSTVWVLGYETTYRYDPNYRDVSDEERNVLRHYSFEKGLLGSFVSLGSISKSRNVSMQVSRPDKTFLRCGKDRVAVLLGATSEYIEIDTSTEKLSRWKVVLPSGLGEKMSGFAVTEEGRSFVGLSDFSDQDNMRTTGLYELKAASGSPVATLVPVAGTITKYDPSKIAPDGTFLYLWGADGNELVMQRQGDGWGLSWARVSAPATMTTKFVELQQ